MYWKLLLILSMVALTRQNRDLDNEESKDCYACLEAANVKCQNGATEEQINNFIKTENCWYQQFMDKLKELDCMIEKKINSEPYEDEERKRELWRQIMGFRNELYDKEKINDEKICNVCETNDTFEKYVSCWKNYWSTMQMEVEIEIEKLKTMKTEDIFGGCPAYGTQHQQWCNNL